MKFLKQSIINIVISGALLYSISLYVPELGLKVTSEYKDTYAVFGILGICYRIVNAVLGKILKIIALPAKFFTLGLSGVIINGLLLYVFEEVVAYLDIGIQVQMGTVTQTAILAIILTSLYVLVKKLI